jgi:hypothetical protein
VITEIDDYVGRMRTQIALHGFERAQVAVDIRQYGDSHE